MGVTSRLRSTTMTALKFAICLLAVPALSLHSPAGGVGGVVGGHGGDHYNEKPDPFHFKYGVHDDKYHTDLAKKGMVMRVVISRESTMYTFLMEGSSMSSTMLMVTMAVPSWKSSMMGKHTILSTMDMDMVGMNNICDINIH